MRVPLPDNEIQTLRRHLKRHIKARYGYQKQAAQAYGITMHRMKAIMCGYRPPTEQMLADAGIRIRWSLT